MKNIVLVFFILIFQNGFSQYIWTEGEIYFKNGKTLEGLVRIPLVSKDLITFGIKEKVRYRKSENDDTIKYGREVVNKIVFNCENSENITFMYVPLRKNKYSLFAILNVGKVVLYGRMVNMTSTSVTGSMSFAGLNELYIKRKEEDVATALLTARPSKSFRKRAIKYFSDCTNVVTKLENKIYTKENALAIVSEYNNSCIN